MAETVSSIGSMEMALKDSTVIVDMSPAALIQHNTNPSIHLNYRGLKESVSRDQSCSETTNLSSSPLTTFHCERCDNFETNSRSSLLLHVVQCLSDPSRHKNNENDAENLSISTISNKSNSNGSVNSASELQSNDNSTNANNVRNGSSPLAANPRKVFECDVCNMKFSNGANMRRHKMRHTGVKPYECRICQKRFFRKDHLAEHFTTHTKTLPYHCPICNRGFQRQIAMRAHFQNEHVGHHDLVKTCPLCSYRAGSMKSLRIHFFNRHGIDLDNPGTRGTSSLLLALESHVSQVAAAASANFIANVESANTEDDVKNCRENGEIHLRENNTPPMHFLTPHVEISTLSENITEIYDATREFDCNISGAVDAGSIQSKNNESDVNNSNPPQTQLSKVSTIDHPIDCNVKTLPSSTSAIGVHNSTPTKNLQHDNHITPSISLIPIKQEPHFDDSICEQNKLDSRKNNFSDEMNESNDGETDSCPSKQTTSIIKISPLKSLLREDLKRRICAKASNRIMRNALTMENNNVLPALPTTNNSTNNSAAICNGTITSTGQEVDVPFYNRKQILTCLFCGIEFPDETLYFLHKGCHCDSNPWKCNICGEQCKNVYEFNSHLLSKSHQ